MRARRLDGATGFDRFVHVTFPIMANLYTVCTLLSTIWTLGDFNTVLLRERRRAGAADRMCWQRSACATPSS